MTLKGLWVRGFCTVGIAVAAQADAAFTHWSEDWGVKEWVHAVTGIVVALFIAVRGFKDQSATDYQNSLPADPAGDYVDAADRPERVSQPKARPRRVDG